MKRMSLVLGAALILAMATVASAQPTLTLSLVYQQSYDNAFGPVVLVDTDPGAPGFQVLPGTVANDDTHVYDIMMTLTGQLSTESFKYLQATGTTTGSMTGSAILGGDPFVPLDPNPLYDPPPVGAPNGGSRALFSMGNDGSSTDLVDLRWSTDAALEAKAAHGLSPGESGAYKIGELWMSINGTTVQGNSLVLGAAAVSTPFQVWTGGTSLSQTGAIGTNLGPERVIASAAQRIDVVPEPATFILLGLAIPALALVRRRKA